MRNWQTVRRLVLSRHVHDRAYASVALAGAYEEAGDLGRFRVSAGDVVFHDRFEAHLDRFDASGATILNLFLPAGSQFRPGPARIADPDPVVRLAQRDRHAAVSLLLSTAVRRAEEPSEWPDELAALLAKNPSVRLAEWGSKRGLSPESISRGFKRMFGVAPAVFRARARARNAWRAIAETVAPLADIAAALGFSDQAHMTRSVKKLTGYPPLVWRPDASAFKTKDGQGV